MKQIFDQQLLKAFVEAHELEAIFGSQIWTLGELFLLDKGDMLCRESDPVLYLYFLVEGESKVFTTLDNGKTYLLRIEEPLTVYGDLEWMDRPEYTANVEALTPCYVLGIATKLIRQHYENDPVFLKYMIRSLATRLEKVSLMSTSNLLLPLKTKFASYLCAHMDEQTQRVVIRSTFTDVAEQLGTTYRHLNRVIREMEVGLMIKKEGKNINIRDYQAIKKMAGDTYRL